MLISSDILLYIEGVFPKFLCSNTLRIPYSLILLSSDILNGFRICVFVNDFCELSIFEKNLLLSIAEARRLGLFLSFSMALSDRRCSGRLGKL